MSVASISPAALAQRRQEDPQLELIDVRTPVEFQEVHVEFARNIPLDVLDPKGVIAARNGSSGKPLYVICRSGGRGQKAAVMFEQAGFPNAVNVEGGTQACEAAGLPVVRGKKAMSLERQVRIAAGSLVLIGAVLAWLVHPAFIALSAFVGAGLVFAGITDTCGMGLLLARMPWNRRPGAAHSCSVK
ncbi:MAG TPA: rhodanese-like domain-containing protein [Pirellulales bacterium]|jgi:rhodanese-related sulfurtransferase|nr:rhodanese-like domain-containing protein [Pirellulales bacterium]